jgi:hypothetical protein
MNPRAVRAAAALGVALGLAACRPPAAPGGGSPPLPDQPVFSDVTESAGIAFTHYNGAFGKKLFPEIMGSGAAWLDGDGDGHQDLLLLTSASLPGDPRPRVARNAYYRNRGDGTFEDRTAASGLAGGGYAMGVAVGDVDRDGDPDVYITHLGRDRFYRNRGDGTFEDRTAAAGLGHEGYGSSAVFFDYDNDGFLDLYVCNYVDLPEPLDRIVCRNPKGRPQYCDVHVYEGLPDVLYHNDGDGTFTEVTGPMGIGAKRGRGLAVVAGDVNDDGFQDLMVANDENPNFLWINEGGKRFREGAAEAGVAYDQRGEAIAGMGLDFGDVDGDGQLDLYESGFQSEPNVFFHRLAPGFFADHTGNLGIGEVTRNYLSFGLGFLDYDLDGWLDLFVTNGHVIDDVTEFNPTIPYEQNATLFRNTGGGRLADATAALGAFGKAKRVGRGVAFADYDNDGDVDFVVTHNHGPAVLVRNDQQTRRRWLGLKLVGEQSNREALGARVTLESGGFRQVREVRAGHSYLSSSDPRLFFGLGDRGGPLRVTVRWPGGKTETREVAAPDRYVTFHEKG